MTTQRRMTVEFAGHPERVNLHRFGVMMLTVRKVKWGRGKGSLTEANMTKLKVFSVRDWLRETNSTSYNYNSPENQPTIPFLVPFDHLKEKLRKSVQGKPPPVIVQTNESISEHHFVLLTEAGHT